jgi:hypothetical protein
MVPLSVGSGVTNEPNRCPITLRIRGLHFCLRFAPCLKQLGGRRLLTVVVVHRPDILHSHRFYLTPLPFRFTKRFRNVKLLLWSDRFNLARLNFRVSGRCRVLEFVLALGR